MEQTRSGSEHTEAEAPGTFEFPVARRGYEPGAVQAYVAASSVELRHLAATNRSLMQRIGDLETRLAAAEAAADAAAAAVARMAATPAPPAPPAADPHPADIAAEVVNGRLPLFAVNRAQVPAGSIAAAAAGGGGRPDQVLAAARAEADQIVAAARARAADIERQADAHVESKRSALIGGLDVLQQAIARTLGQLADGEADTGASHRTAVRAAS
jgi:cell division septum initiation protein DivIVA